MISRENIFFAQVSALYLHLICVLCTHIFTAILVFYHAIVYEIPSSLCSRATRWVDTCYSLLLRSYLSSYIPSSSPPSLYPSHSFAYLLLQSFNSLTFPFFCSILYVSALSIYSCPSSSPTHFLLFFLLFVLFHLLFRYCSSIKILNEPLLYLF